MAIIEIPTLTDGTTAYDQRIELEGVEWLFSFQWNARVDRWFMSINALDGAPVLAGAGVPVGIRLNRRAVGGPPGDLIAVSETASLEPPGLLELGDRVRLYYVEAVDVVS